MIKEEYKNNKSFINLNKFFIYFENTWTKKVQINDWNIYEIVLKRFKEKNIDNIFFTNNVVESLNSRLNIKKIRIIQ